MKYGYYTVTFGRLVAVRVLGFRERKPKRRKKKSSFWEPDMDVFDWEEFNKRNAR